MDSPSPEHRSFKKRIDDLLEKYQDEPEMLQEVERVAQKLAEQRLAMRRATSARKKKRKQVRQSRRANR